MNCHLILLKIYYCKDLLLCDSAISQPLVSFPEHLDLLRAEIGTYLGIVGQLLFLFPWMKYLQ